MTVVGVCGGYNLGQRGGARRPVINTGPPEAEQGITGEATFFREPADGLLVPNEPYPSPPKNPAPAPRPRPAEPPQESAFRPNDPFQGGDAQTERPFPVYGPTFNTGQAEIGRGYAQVVRRPPSMQWRQHEFLAGDYNTVPKVQEPKSVTQPRRRGHFDHDEPQSYRLESAQTSPSQAGGISQGRALATGPRDFPQREQEVARRFDGRGGRSETPRRVAEVVWGSEGEDVFPASGYDIYDAQRSRSSGTQSRRSSYY